MIDHIGRQYGDLLVTGKSDLRHESTGEVLWKVKCRCGNSKELRTSKLVTQKSCGNCKVDERTRSFENEVRVIKKKKGKATFGSLDLKVQLEVVNDYCFGLNIDDLTKKYSIDSISCRDGINAFRERLNTMHELHYMVRTEKTKVAPSVIDRALSTTVITDSIKPLLSEDDSEELTLQEELYCYLYVYTGSNDIAIKESGFQDCIPKDTSMKRQLLGMFLREKPNLKEYISILKDGRVQEVKSSKQIVQHELINQVEQLKEAVAQGGTSQTRGHLLRAIELLGKTVGAFEEHVKVTSVNASEALDELLEMARRESGIKEVPYDPTSEHYEVIE